MMIILDRTNHLTKGVNIRRWTKNFIVRISISISISWNGRREKNENHASLSKREKSAIPPTIHFNYYKTFNIKNTFIKLSLSMLGKIFV